MTQILAAAYPWTKALHIVSMVAWMAGLFYLPRLFVYHVERAAAGSEASEMLKVMERKLFRLIMNPAMMSTWVFGILLIATLGPVALAHQPWIYLKLALVVLLTGFHQWLGARQRDFADDLNAVSGRTYRILNELPAVVLLAVVILVVVKPF